MLTNVTIVAAVVGGVAFVAYFFVAYDLLYHRLSKRLTFDTFSDFVLRTVLLLGGAMALPLVLEPMGADVSGLMGLLNAPFGAVLAAGGIVLAIEGAGLLRKRFAVVRASPYVGQDVGDGLVALHGAVTPRETSDDQQVRADGGQETDDEPRLMTDGGRPQDGDPFEGTEFEPVESDDGVRSDVSPFDPGPSPFEGDDAGTTGSSSANGQLRDRPSPDRTLEADASDTAPDRSAVDPTTEVDVDPAAVDGVPVAVDGDTGRVVATRADCTNNGWRKAVANWLATSFEREHDVDLRRDPQALSRLVSVADRVRDDLETRTETEVLLPFIAEVDGRVVHLRRSLVAVDEDGTPRSEPPFSESFEAESATADPRAEPVERGSEDEESDDRAADEPDPEPVETESVDEPEADETTDREDRPAVVRTPHTGTEAVLGRHKRRTQVSPPGVLDRLPVDRVGEKAPEVPDGVLVRRRVQRLLDRMPDSVEVPDVPGSALLADEITLPNVADRFPERVDLPGMPDVHEHRDEEPGVRVLAEDERIGVPFEVDSFGRVEVDPEGAALLMDVDDAGTDGPGFWYEKRVEPGDVVSIVGEATTVEAGELDLVVGDGEDADLIVGDGDLEDLKSSLTRGGLLRLAVGVPAGYVGTSMVLSNAGVDLTGVVLDAVLGALTTVGGGLASVVALPFTVAASVPAPVYPVLLGLAGLGYWRREDVREEYEARVAPHLRRKLDAVVDGIADRVHEVETTRIRPEGRVRRAVHELRAAPWRALSEITDAVEERRN